MPPKRKSASKKGSLKKRAARFEEEEEVDVMVVVAAIASTVVVPRPMPPPAKIWPPVNTSSRTYSSFWLRCGMTPEEAKTVRFSNINLCLNKDIAAIITNWIPPLVNDEWKARNAAVCEEVT